MVKSNFFKKYSKPIALLAILIILSMLLFSSYNEYSVENLTPKPNIEMELYLWTGPTISGNDLQNRWVEFIENHDNIPNITLGRGKAIDFPKYLELDKYPNNNLDTNEKLKVLKSVDFTKDNKLIPFVSVFIVYTREGKTYKEPFVIYAEKDVTYDNFSKIVYGLPNMFYDALYDSDFNVAPPPVVPTAPTAPAASAASATSSAASAATAARAVNLSNFFNS